MYFYIAIITNVCPMPRMKQHKDNKNPGQVSAASLKATGFLVLIKEILYAKSQRK